MKFNSKFNDVKDQNKTLFKNSKIKNETYEKTINKMKTSHKYKDENGIFFPNLKSIIQK